LVFSRQAKTHLLFQSLGVDVGGVETMEPLGHGCDYPSLRLLSIRLLSKTQNQLCADRLGPSGCLPPMRYW
jgi:hypothetical protein